MATDINQAMDADQRQIFGKVEITYTDPFTDETIQYTASEIGRYTYPDELSDGITSPLKKWFSLHENTLNGTYAVMPAHREYSVGWWGTQLSNLDGNFADPPMVTVTFTARAIPYWRVVGDDKLDVYPVNFNVQLFDSEGVMRSNVSVEGNSSTDYTWNFTNPILNIVRLELIIYSINKPACVAKLMELFTAVKEEYDQDMIESFTVMEEIGYSSGSLQLGNISSNEIDIVLNNTDRRFDLDNTQSSLYGYVKKNRRIRAWFGVELNGQVQWYPRGTFWTTTWDISPDQLVARVVGRDRLELLRLTDYTTSVLETNKSLYYLFETVLLDAGLTIDEFEIDTQLQNIIIPKAWFDVMTHRQALQRLASCAIIQVYCTRDDKIKINYGLDTNTPAAKMTFDPDKNVYSTSYPLAVAEQVNYVEVTSKTYSPSNSQALYTSSDPFTIPANQSVTHTYKSQAMPVISMNSPTISASPATVSITAFQVYAWGCVVTYRNTGSTAATVNSVTVNGTVFQESSQQTVIAKDDQLIKEDGKIRVAIQHDFIQSTSYAQSLSTTILNAYKSARYDVTIENRGHIDLSLGDKVNVIEPTRTAQYMVSRQRYEWSGYLQATTEGKML